MVVGEGSDGSAVLEKVKGMSAVTGIMDSRRGAPVFFILALVVYVAAMYVRLGVEIADDGAFFLRYADNMAKGQFWVWNLGEAPIWGASAPLYPLLLAVPIALGAPSVAALVVTSIGLASLALAGVATLLLLQFGFVAAFAFLVMSGLDTGMMYFSGSGMETPLTFALLALGVAGVLCHRLTWTIGLCAGLLMVNKLDLVPAGGLLLLAVWLRDRRFPFRSTVVAGLIAAAWYGFAWVYFGYPVPNSFLTKSLHQNHIPTDMTWRWFGTFVFLTGLHAAFALFSFVALFWRRNWPLAVFLLGFVLVQTVAYTIKYPFEAYNWYCMPAVFALCVLGAIGFCCLSNALLARAHNGVGWLRTAVPVAVLCLYGAWMARDEIVGANFIKFVAASVEFDRSEAGRWVADNTPDNFSVLTLWGNPAYYSKRKVIDASFLNRKYEDGDLLSKYAPEIIIMQNKPGATPSDPTPALSSARYKTVKVFDKAFLNGLGYFFMVLVRDDVLEKVSNKDSLSRTVSYFQNVVLGDEFGKLSEFGGRNVVFVHPGRTTPTTFSFDVNGYLKDLGRSDVTLVAEIDPRVPAEAIKRGGGTAHIVVSARGKELGQAVVRQGQPFTLQVPAAAGDVLDISVDANGAPDTNWLLLTFK